MKKICTLSAVLMILLFAAASLPAQNYQSDKKLNIYHTTLEDGRYVFYADNNHFIPVFINLNFTVLQNLTSSVSLPLKTAVPAGAKKLELLILTPVPEKALRFQSSYSYTEGDPFNTKPDPDYPWLIPFEHGRKFKLVQGFNGRSTHSESNAYAVDFEMETGTPVHAARAGLVSYVKQDSNIGGLSRAYENAANLITLYHEDGSFSNYVHLKYKGSLVKEGDTVAAGQLIGYSGNTGYSSGPHLHFSVNVPGEDGRSSSIPFKFITASGKTEAPAEGLYYYARHPGLRAFEEKYGAELTDSNFEGWNKTADKTDKIQTRTVKDDDTNILFVSNGFDRPVELQFTFTLNNLVSSKGKTITLKAEALQEVYICMLKPLDPGKPYSYSWSYRYSFQ
jgi:murein DD-endopeptidase MepM/ murein hydrolase activator NlpD